MIEPLFFTTTVSFLKLRVFIFMQFVFNQSFMNDKTLKKVTHISFCSYKILLQYLSDISSILDKNHYTYG